MQTRSPASALPSEGETGPGSPGLDPLFETAAHLLEGDRATALGRLGDRWQQRQLVTLVTGEFKRGKSTLLNALAGADVLPTGVLPVTAVPTRVSAGPTEVARVLFLNGTTREIPVAQVRDYVDESRNRGNRLRVESVEVKLTAGVSPGLVLVDVPGLGSSHAHNTEAALAALPEADAALVVVSVDPPIGQAELSLIEALSADAARVDVVLNKLDYLDERGREAAERFTRETLASRGHHAVAVWPVSARAGLEARLSRDDVGWRRSGMRALAEGLQRFFRDEREQALARSLARKAGRLVDEELALAEIEIAASERSSAELRKLIAEFSKRRATAERDSAEAQLVFGRRFDTLFEGYTERAANVWRERRAVLGRAVSAIVEARSHLSRAAAWRELQAAAHAAAADFIETFLSSERPRLHADYGRLRDEVTRAAAERAEAVWRMAAELLPFSMPRVEAAPAPAIRRPGALQLEEIRLTLEDLEDAVSALLPRRLALRRLVARAVDEADGRYGRAVEQSRKSFMRAYEADFRGLIAQFSAAARQTASAVETALRAAEARIAAVEHGLRSEVNPLARRRVSLVELKRSLQVLEERV